MVARTRKAFFQGINAYCPGMAYASDIMIGTPTPFSIGTPAAAAISAITSNAGAANVNTKYAITTNSIIDSVYGRALRIDLSGVPGNTPVIRAFCEDYLGQPVVIDFTGSAAATTTTASASKAIKRVLFVQATTPASNAVNIQVGTTNDHGLPYKSNIAYHKSGNPAQFLDPAGIFALWTKPVLTDPQTVATGDPRGTYSFTGNGTNELVLGLEGDPTVNAAGNGGLHGIRHFGG